MKFAIAIGVIVIAGGLVYTFWPATNEVALTKLDANQTKASLVEVSLPDKLSQNAQVGKLAFDATCAACHGENAAGQDGVAPPLIHKIYEPSHHGDESFHRAVSMGVLSHHWPFGDMPPIEGNTRSDITMIIAYIRELQRANGIN